MSDSSAQFDSNTAEAPIRMVASGNGVAAVALVFVVVVSVAIHAALAWWLGLQPIGYVNVSDMLAVREPVRIKRATSDFMVTPPAEQGSGSEPIDLSVVSEALLEEKTALPQEAPSPETPMREVDPQEQAGQPETAKFEPTLFEVSQESLSLLQIGKPAELEVSTGQGGFGEGLGRGDTSAGTGAATSSKLLQQAGLSGARVPEPLAIEPPKLTLPEPRVVEKMVDLPLVATPMDFAAMGLKGTEQLEIPEHLDDDFDYVVTRQPGRVGEAGYFKVEIVPKRSLRRLETMPKDVVFIIDTSASIPQTWVEQMVAGVKFALGSLNPGDRFNIMMFSERPRLFSEQIQPATQANFERALKFLDDAASSGATDVNAALSRLLTRDLNQQRVYNLVLLSDGRPTRGVMDTRDLINIITRDNDLNSSIYCVGIGPQANRELLDFLAYRNKGFSVFVDDRRRVATEIRELMSRLRFPLIKDVAFNVAGLDAATVFPKDLPNIHQNERFAIYGRYPQPQTFTIRMTGRTAGGKAVDFSFSRSLNDAPLTVTPIDRDWAFWKLHHLYSEIIRQGQTTPLMQQIEELKLRYGVKTLY